MDNLEHNKPSEEKIVSSPSHLQTWSRRLALLATLVGGGIIMEGCATTLQARPDTEVHDSVDSKQILLRMVGAAKDGQQPDGSEVQFGEGATKEEAEENAKAVIEMLMEENVELSYKSSQAMELPDGTYLICVKGEKKLPGMNPETKKRWIKFNQRKIYYLIKEYKEYKRKYGNRKKFPAFAAKVHEIITELEKQIKDLQSGEIASGTFRISGGTIDEVASDMAETSIRMADSDVELLSMSESMDEMFRELDRKTHK